MTPEEKKAQLETLKSLQSNEWVGPADAKAAENYEAYSAQQKLEREGDSRGYKATDDMFYAPDKVPGLQPSIGLEDAVLALTPSKQMPLEMSKSARLSRAEEMGFDTSKPLYHGTINDFDKFNPSKKGLLGEGVYVSKNADAAGMYASDQAGNEIGHIMPLYGPKNVLNLEDTQEVIKFLKNAGVEDSLIQSMQSKISRPSHLAYKALEAKNIKTPLADLAKKQNYSGISEYGGDIVSIFDPSKIRSVNAAFDPAKKHSSNILAGGAAALGLAGGTVEAEAAEKDSKKSKLAAIEALISADPAVAKPKPVKEVVTDELKKKPKFQFQIDSVPGGRRG